MYYFRVEFREPMTETTHSKIIERNQYLMSRIQVFEVVVLGSKRVPNVT